MSTLTAPSQWFRVLLARGDFFRPEEKTFIWFLLENTILLINHFMLLKSEKYCFESLEINGLIYTMLTFRFTPVCCRFVIVIESAAVVL